MLFITEGKKEEPQFLRKMLGCLFGTSPDNVFCYGANLHQLMRKLPPEEIATKNLDLVLWLREYANDRNEEFPRGRFTDVFLIFDMDPHDQNYNNGIHIKNAMNLFTESSERGLLLINYPMIQSYKHMKELSDNSYLESVVDFNGIRDYKHLVDNECCQSLKELPKYTAETFGTLIDLNLRKMKLILNKQDRRPPSPGYDGEDYQKLLNIQMNKLKNENAIFIINTSLFIAVEIDPARFLEEPLYE